MATGLYYREKVVRNCLLVFFTFVILSASAQSLSSKRISLTLQKASLREVIDQLSLATGLHFIYSPDKIKTKVFSLTLHDKTIPEALTSAGFQLNLEFRQQDQYVIVKANEFGQLIARADVRIQPELRLRQQPAPVAPYFPPPEPHVSGTVRVLQPDSVNRFQKYMKQLQPYFDSTWLKRIPTPYVQKLNLKNKHRGWFVAAGSMFNDYSKGIELQAGIREAYFVYNPSWMSSGQYHGAYGLGSSILLARNFAVNPVYTYTTINWKYPTEYAIARLMYGPSQLRVTTHHHQVKLMLSYAIHKNLQLRVGPTFNRATTNYQFAESDRYIFRNWIPHSMTSSAPAWRTSATRANVPVEIFAIKLSSYESIRTWVGYEASLLVRINFNQK